MIKRVAAWASIALCLAIVSNNCADADNVSPSGEPLALGTAGSQGANPEQPTQPADGVIDDSDPAWVWSGMVAYTDANLHGGTGHVGGPGTYGTYTFHGTGVDVYGITAPTIRVGKEDQLMGRARVLVDGKDAGLSTMSSPDTQYNALICHVAGLASGNHVMQVRSDCGWIVVDYMKVTNDPEASGYSGETIIRAGNYAIYPRNALDKCVSVGALTSRSQVAIYTPGKSRNQMWHVTPLARDRFRISPVGAPSEALTVVGPYTEPWGTVVGKVGLYSYVGDPAQQWIAKRISDQYFQLLVVAQVRAVLDVNGKATSDGTMLIAYPNKDETNADGYNEEFAFQPVAD